MIKAENQKKRKPFTAQDTIPYKEIYKDGICRTDDNYYSKMVQFYDINYQLAQNDDKAAIFENYCEFLNSFDSSVEVQITFLNQQVNFDEYAKNIDIPEQDDCFNDIRKEYSDMLKMQLSKGNNGLVKREILNVFLITDDDIIICDPEGEYFPLVNALNGEVIKISAKSNDYINPMEVNLDVIYHPEKYRINGDVEDIDTIIADKAEFITSFCEVIMKKPQNAELNGDEVSMIDLCVKDIYKKYLYNDPKPENMPTLQDFYERLNFYAPDKPAAQNIANSLQLYVTGSQNVFNHRSNVDTQNRVVCFDIRELGTTLRKAGMLIVQHMVWTRVSQNRSRRKSTRYYVDEFHLLLNQPQTANYSIEMWKRFRKWGGIITGISQNVTDFLGSLAVESIVGNSDFILMLNQHSGDQKILAEKLNISKHQISFVNNSNAGEGLLFYGNVIIPFADRYPQDTRTYALMSTKPDEIQT